jgi:hypothetical protein
MSHIAPKLYADKLPFLYDSKEHIYKLYNNQSMPDKQTHIDPSPYANYISQHHRISRNEIIKSMLESPVIQAPPVPVQVLQPARQQAANALAANAAANSDSDESVESVESEEEVIRPAEKKENYEDVIYSNLRKPLNQYRIDKLKQYIPQLKSLADQLYNVVKLNPSFPILTTQQKYNYLLTVLSHGKEFNFICMCDYSLPLYLLDEIENYYDILDQTIGLRW